MKKHSLEDFVIRQADLCGGQPVIRGTRVTLRTVLASLADGDSVEEILRGFPTLLLFCRDTTFATESCARMK